MSKEYALYHGDDFLIIGTIEELAAYLNVTYNTVKFYKSPSYLKKTNGNGYVVVDCEEEDEISEKHNY